MNRKEINLELVWEPAGMEDGCRHRLISRDWLSINGLPMHVMAIEVYEQDGVGQTAVDDEFEGDLTNLIAVDDTAYQTVEIEGRTYIIYATPHGA